MGIHLQLVERGIGCTDGDTANTSSLDWARHERMFVCANLERWRLPRRS